MQGVGGFQGHRYVEHTQEFGWVGTHMQQCDSSKMASHHVLTN
jgi:hypothetical protein